MTVQIRSAEEVKELEEASAPVVENVRYQHASFEEAVDQPAEADKAAAQPFQRHMGKVGRNDPCPCGSGKKFKQCHGKLI